MGKIDGASMVDVWRRDLRVIESCTVEGLWLTVQVDEHLC